MEALESAWPRNTSASYNACMARSCSWYIRHRHGVDDDVGIAVVQAGQPGNGRTGVLAPVATGLCLVGGGPRSEREQPLAERRRYSFTFDAGHGSGDRALGVAGDESHLRAHRVEPECEEAGLLREELVSPGQVRLRLRRPTLPPSQ